MSFFFNDTATTEIYTLSLHDALPIWTGGRLRTFSGMTGTRHRRTLHNRAAVGLTAAALVAAAHSDSPGQAGPALPEALDSTPVTAPDDATAAGGPPVLSADAGVLPRPPPRYRE